MHRLFAEVIPLDLELSLLARFVIAPSSVHSCKPSSASSERSICHSGASLLLSKRYLTVPTTSLSHPSLLGGATLLASARITLTSTSNSVLHLTSTSGPCVVHLQGVKPKTKLLLQPTVSNPPNQDFWWETAVFLLSPNFCQDHNQPGLRHDANLGLGTCGDGPTTNLGLLTCGDGPGKSGVQASLCNKHLFATSIFLQLQATAAMHKVQKRSVRQAITVPFFSNLITLKE